MSGLPSDPLIAEEIRRLTGTLLAGSSGIRSILLTGPIGGEGATTIAALLAMALAAKDETSVLLVDANVRAPRLHALLDLPAAPGLLECTADAPPTYQSVHGHERLTFLSAGTVATDPRVRTGLDCVTALPSLVQRARDEFAYVVWDVAPALLWSDVTTLAPLVDGVIVIAEVDHTRRDQLSCLREQLEGANANLLGAVMNRNARYWPLRWSSLRSSSLRWSLRPWSRRA